MSLNLQNFTAKSLLTIGLGVSLISCGKATDLDKIADAQACLDKITSSSDSTGIAACKSKVSGLTSTGAQSILCSANFMREGFTNPSDIASKMANLNNGDTTALMSAITFTTGANVTEDALNAKNTFQYCRNSGGKGATILSAFAYIPMAIIEAGNDGAGTSQAQCAKSGGAYNLSNCVTAMAVDGNLSSASLKTAIGQVVIATYDVSCASSSANEDLCNMLSTAITNGGGGSNPQGVGDALLEDIANTSIP